MFMNVEITKLTDVKVEHYSGEAWTDFTPYLIGFNVTDHNINTVPHASLLLFGDRSDFDEYLNMPYRLIRIQTRPESVWQPIFYGYVSHPLTRKIAGTHSTINKIKLSLDCVGAANRLTKDYVSFDYYKLQSAISPHVGSENNWTYRRMIEDMLSNPDSGEDTGFVLHADVNEVGIDANIDRSCSWDRQTILEAVRIVCDRIGYDGYYAFDDTHTPGLYLQKYDDDQTVVAALDPPFINEPEYNYGDINDVFNHIYVWGGVDKGVPSDGDKWTEYGVEKYDPTIWSGETDSNDGTVTPSDVDNTDFAEDYRVNNKAIKFLHTGWSGIRIYGSARKIVTRAALNIANAGLTVDAANRISAINFNIHLFGGGEDAAGAKYGSLYAIDNSGNVIKYANVIALTNPTSASSFICDLAISVELGGNIALAEAGTDGRFGMWQYVSGADFNWADIRTLKIEVDTHFATATPAGEVGFTIDGLQFVGGYPIEPFQPYSTLLNRPVTDEVSKGYYGVSVLHHQDTLLTSFEQAQTEGQRLLNNLAYPHGTLTIQKGDVATTLLKPSMYVTVEGLKQRIADIQYDWHVKDKKVKVTYTLVDPAQPLPPIWTTQNELKRAIK